MKALNTLGFDQRAELFATAQSEADIEQAVRYAEQHGLPLQLIGGGSNLVLVNDLPGLVLQLKTHAIQMEEHSDHRTLVTVDAGTNWHFLVDYTLRRDIPGLENLSLIPGTVGAAPVQNIGAYGVEVKDRITQVRALHRDTLQWHDFPADECHFSYRHSYFKDHPDQYIISKVQFSLGHQHAVQSEYASLKTHLEARGIHQPSARQVSDCVIEIRKSRLPDPDVIGNAGSFFHNPIIDESLHHRLKHSFPDLVSYPQTDGSYKLAAGWLIDHLGYKGVERDGVGVHAAQALVLVNTGNGTGRQLLALAEEIRTRVHDTFGVRLQIEPRVLV